MLSRVALALSDLPLELIDRHGLGRRIHDQGGSNATGGSTGQGSVGTVGGGGLANLNGAVATVTDIMQLL
jgi:hypothetical protein